MTKLFSYQVKWQEENPEFQSDRSLCQTQLNGYDEFFKQSGWDNYDLKLVEEDTKNFKLIINFPSRETRNEMFGAINSYFEMLDSTGKTYFRDIEEEMSYECPDVDEGEAHSLNEWWQYVYNRIPFGSTFLSQSIGNVETN